MTKIFQMIPTSLSILMDGLVSQYYSVWVEIREDIRHLSRPGTGVTLQHMSGPDYCKYTLFRAVHFFMDFANLKICANMYSAKMYKQLPFSKMHKFKYTQNCTFQQMRENLYMQKYLCLQ